MNKRDRDKQLIKALYKYMLDNYKKSAKNKDVANQVVADVLDPNHKAQIDPDKIPSSKSSVMSKAKGEEKQRRKKLGSIAHWKREKEHMKTGTMKDGTKYTTPGRPERHHEFGINKPHRGDKNSGTSVAGHHIKEKTNPVIPVKEQRKDNIAHLKAAPKPNLPKSEKGMEKGDLPLSDETASNPVSRPDAGFGDVVVKNNRNAPNAKKPVQLNPRIRVKGVKRLKAYMQEAKKN